MPLAINKFSNKNDMCRQLSAFIINKLKDVVGQKGFATVVLSGGRTPLNLYRQLLPDLISASLDLDKIYFFFSDERFSKVEEDSNYRLAQDHLLSQANISFDNIFPMISNRSKSITDNRDAYAKTIDSFFINRESEIVFDIVILGIGLDGHTASIFPGDNKILSKDIVRDVYPKNANPPVPRLTLGLETINKSSNIVFVTDSLEKEGIVKKVLENTQDYSYPASLVNKEKSSFYFVAS